jgi:hypothetical protein
VSFEPESSLQAFKKAKRKEISEADRRKARRRLHTSRLIYARVLWFYTCVHKIVY